MAKFIEISKDSLKHFIDGRLFSRHIGGMYSPDELCELCPSLDNDVFPVYIVPHEIGGQDAVTLNNVMLLCSRCRDRVRHMTPVEQALACIMLTRYMPYEDGRLHGEYLRKRKRQGDLAPRDGDECRVCGVTYSNLSKCAPHAGHLIAKMNMKSKNTPGELPAWLVQHESNYVRICSSCNVIMGKRTPTLTPTSLHLILKPWGIGKSLSVEYLNDEAIFAEKVTHTTPVVVPIVASVMPAESCSDTLTSPPLERPGQWRVI